MTECHGREPSTKDAVVSNFERDEATTRNSNLGTGIDSGTLALYVEAGKRRPVTPSSIPARNILPRIRTKGTTAGAFPDSLTDDRPEKGAIAKWPGAHHRWVAVKVRVASAPVRTTIRSFS
jgi:hypothetical protein